MKRIYIAGKYDDENIISCLANIRQGIEMAVKLAANGYAVYCPFLDFLFALVRGGAELDKQDFQKNSMAWVEVSDALLILDNWRTSNGTKREIARAEQLLIPIFYNIHELYRTNCK
jgi:hypothetical protein